MKTPDRLAIQMRVTPLRRLTPAAVHVPGRSRPGPSVAQPAAPRQKPHTGATTALSNDAATFPSNSHETQPWAPHA
ncbi:hypothetical protein ACH4U7_50395 [Streptomyces sp. NPDC020845]|uniref:hypothetical protein n=1 Tax=Streptomyces sp. NPDC020845 TaxID=3365096 RepID=UPI0037B652CE